MQGSTDRQGALCQNQSVLVRGSLIQCVDLIYQNEKSDIEVPNWLLDWVNIELPVLTVRDPRPPDTDIFQYITR